MPIRGLDSYLKERKLIQNCPISALNNTRLGIDATYYLNHLLTDPDTREPLVAATGGLPLAIVLKIENDLRALERQGIKPVFVFSGLPLASRPPPKGPDAKAERENIIKNEAWALYDQGEPLAAVEKLVQFNNGNFVDQKDLLRSIMRLFRHRFVEFVVAPYLGFAQLAYLLQHPRGYIHAIYSSTECLLWPVEKVITSSDWNTSFSFVDKAKVLNDLNLASEQFLDFGLLAGSSITRTLPLPPHAEFSIKSVADLVRMHKFGLAVCHSLRQEQPYKTQLYVESFWKARLAIKFFLVLTTDGTCVPLPTVITSQQQAFTIQDVPGDLEEIFSPRIPDELYFHICRGLISAQVVGWLTSGMIVESQPLLETNEYRRFIKDVITEGHTSPRCTTVALLADVLHPDWSKRRVNVHYYFDPPYAPVRGSCVPFTDALTQSLIARCTDWMVPMFNLEMELRRQNSSTIDLKLCIGALAKEELVNRTLKPKGERVLDKKDEIVANVIWRFLEVRGFVQQNHTHSLIGKALHACFSVSRVNDRFQESLYLILELLRAGVVHGGKWGGADAEGFAGGPSYGDNDEQDRVRLIMRCISVLPLMLRPQQWIGPLSQELLAFNSFVRALSKSLRQLFEAVSVHLLLSGDGRRNRDDYSDIMLSLPFQTDVSTGFGILIKTYLDATTYHNEGESINMDNYRSEKVVKAKKDAISFVEDNLTSIRNPVQELSRGFRFWDTIMVAIRSLEEEQGPNPKFQHTVVGKDVIDQFVRADEWLKPMRP
nr:XPG domain-containing protein [Cryptococcus depauperatus CBS 7855]